MGQRLGWDILPRHFYSEIPDIGRLRATAPWKKRYPMDRVAGGDVALQAAFLQSLVSPALRDRIATGSIYADACHSNGVAGFGQIEAECLFAFVHAMRPRTIVQVGCGVSTAVCLQAATAAEYAPRVICIEPFPTSYLERLSGSGTITLIRQGVEHLDAAEIVGPLASGDLLFVDSTHCLGPAGEVTRLIVETLPRLPSGAYAHFHDIYFPYDYSPYLMTTELFFHHESPLLHAFLLDNARCRLVLAMSQLHHDAPQAMQQVFRNYRPCPMDDGLVVGDGHFPSSVYLRAE